MKVTVLGGSAAAPNPGQGCSGYLLECGRTSLLVDCGPGILPSLLRYRRLDNLDAIVLSHLHQDHVLDIVPMRYALKYAPALHRRRIPLWVPPGGSLFLQSLAQVLALGSEAADSFFAETFEIAEFDPQSVLEVPGWEIRFHPTRHWIPCWALRVTCPHATVVYTADTGWDDTLPSFAHGADLLIAEATLPVESEPDARSGHLTASDAAVLAALADVNMLLLTHYWEPLDEANTRALVHRSFSGSVLIARTGLIVDLGPKGETQ